jgi:hypothetical protein
LRRRARGLEAPGSRGTPSRGGRFAVDGRGDPEDVGLAVGEGGEGLGAEPAEGLAPDPAGRDETSGAEAPDVPGDEGLRQPDLSDELRDGRLRDG